MAKKDELYSFLTSHGQGWVADTVVKSKGQRFAYNAAKRKAKRRKIGFVHPVYSKVDSRGFSLTHSTRVRFKKKDYRPDYDYKRKKR